MLLATPQLPIDTPETERTERGRAEAGAGAGERGVESGTTGAGQHHCCPRVVVGGIALRRTAVPGAYLDPRSLQQA